MAGTNIVDPNTANPTAPTSASAGVTSNMVNMPTWLDQLNNQVGNQVSGLASYYNNPSQNWYQGPQVAGFSTLQQNAQDAAAQGFNNQPYQQGALNALGNVQGNLQQAQGATALGQGLQGNAIGALSQYQTQYDPNQVQQFLDPYTDSAVQAMYRQSNQNLQENILPGVNSSFTGNGQFGSTRNGVFADRAIRDTQQANANTAAGMYNTQFNNAQNQYQQWNQNPLAAAAAWNNQANTANASANQWNQNAGASGTAAGQIGQAGTTAANNFWTNNQNQQTTGATQQANQQTALDKAYQTWQQQYQSPLQAMASLQPTIAGLSSAYRPNMIQTTSGLPTSGAQQFMGGLGQLFSTDPSTGTSGTPTPATAAPDWFTQWSASQPSYGSTA